MLSLVHKAASPGLGLLRPSHSGPDQAPASTSAGWNKSGTWKMLPYKKRRTTLRESAQHQGNQEEDDVDLQADEEANDDHPEYNFLEELDEPDAKDFCTDQAVRITSESVFIMSHALDFSTATFCLLCSFLRVKLVAHLD
nr:GON-4-like protein isoform X7 [Bubalus bubalis]